MDVEFCSAINLEIAASATPWESFKATPTLWNQIPAKCGIYMFLFESTLRLTAVTSVPSAFQWVLYVGRAGSPDSTKTLKDRYRAEYSKYIGGDPNQLWDATHPRTREDRLKKYLSIYPLRYWFSIIEDRYKIPVIENRLIKILNPPLNVAGRSRLKIMQPEPAFRSDENDE